jgi:hypothetical protein
VVIASEVLARSERVEPHTPDPNPKRRFQRMKSTLISLPTPAAPKQRLSPRRRVSGQRRRGRAWINGREVGGMDPRFAHLAAIYD